MGAPTRLDVVLGTCKVSVTELTALERADLVKGVVEKLLPLLQYLPGFQEISRLAQDRGSYGPRTTRHTRPDTLVLSEGLEADTRLLRLSDVEVKGQPTYDDPPSWLFESVLLATREGRLVLWEARYTLTREHVPFSRQLLRIHQEATSSEFALLDYMDLAKATKGGSFNLTQLLIQLSGWINTGAARRERQIAQLHAADAWVQDLRQRLSA
jgi:hypothetical protein